MSSKCIHSRFVKFRIGTTTVTFQWIDMNVLIFPIINSMYKSISCMKIPNYVFISSVVFFDFPAAAKFRWAQELSGRFCQDELLPFWEGVWLYISRHEMAWPFVISSCNAYIDPAVVTDLDIWLHMYLCLLLGYFSLESATSCGGRKGISWEPEETVENNSQIAGNLRRIDAYAMSF